MPRTAQMIAQQIGCVWVSRNGRIQECAMLRSYISAISLKGFAEAALPDIARSARPSARSAATAAAPARRRPSAAWKSRWRVSHSITRWRDCPPRARFPAKARVRGGGKRRPPRPPNGRHHCRSRGGALRIPAGCGCDKYPRDQRKTAAAPARRGARWPSGNLHQPNAPALRARG